MSNGESKFAVVIREGANLSPETWTDARISAVARMLPSDVQDDASLIAFLSLSAKYDLDPFAGEIFAWLNPKTKKVQTHISRDGLTKKLRQSPEVEGYTAQIVYSSDEFTVDRKPSGKIEVVHLSSPFAAGSEPIGAYAHVKGAGPRPDVIVTRRIEDYRHLFNKGNWKDAAQDMILARVVSAVARLVTDLSGVYVPEDFTLSEEGSVTGAASARVSRETIDELKAGIVKPTETVIEVEADFVEEDIGKTVKVEIPADPTDVIADAAVEVVGTLETIVEVEPEEETVDPLQVDLLDRTDEDADAFVDLPDGYTVDHTGAQWYHVYGPDGRRLEEKKYRSDDAIERALKDVARAEVVRRDIAEIIKANEIAPEAVLEARERFASGLGLADLSEVEWSGTTLDEFRRFLEDKLLPF